MTESAQATPRVGRYRSWLVGAGVLLTAVSGAYLILYAFQHQSELRLTRLEPRDLPWVVTACAVYCGALLFSAFGWLAAVRASGGSTRGTLAVSIALVSQIGKYVPGNLAQHIGRVVFASSRGMPIAVVMKSTLFELGSAVFAGVSVALVAGAISFHRGDPVLVSLSANAPSPVVVLVAGLGLLVLSSCIALRFGVARRVIALSPLAAAGTLLAHLLSVAVSGLSFFAVVKVFAASDVSPLYCIALFSSAWVMGFVTPGAPAGLGVRETILLVGLSSVLGPLSLPAALMHRLVSAIADGLMAVAGAILLRSPAANGGLTS